MFAPAEKGRFAPTKFAPNVSKKFAPSQISKIAMFAPKKLPLPTPQLYWKIAPETVFSPTAQKFVLHVNLPFVQAPYTIRKTRKFKR